MSDLDAIEASQAPAKTSTWLSPPAKLIICALFIQAWLVILHFRLAGHATANVRVIGQAFDLMRESSIPTAFAALQAMIACVIAGIIARVARKNGSTKRRWLGWLGVMAIFLIIAADDAAAIHERVNAIVSLELIERLQYPSYPWHVIFVPFFVVALLVTLWTVRADLTLTLAQKISLVVALLCFALSQSFDFAEGWEMMTRTLGDPIPTQLTQMMLVEEIMEMIGTTLFIYVFLTTLLHNLPQLFPSMPRSTKTEPTKSLNRIS